MTKSIYSRNLDNGNIATFNGNYLVSLQTIDGEIIWSFQDTETLFALPKAWSLETMIDYTTENFEAFRERYQDDYYIFKQNRYLGINFESAPDIPPHYALKFSPSNSRMIDESLTLHLTDEQIKTAESLHNKNRDGYLLSLVSENVKASSSVFVSRWNGPEYKHGFAVEPRLLRARPSSQPVNKIYTDYDRSWQDEIAMQIGMGMGLQAYNDYRGDY